MFSLYFKAYKNGYKELAFIVLFLLSILYSSSLGVIVLSLLQFDVLLSVCALLYNTMIHKLIWSFDGYIDTCLPCCWRREGYNNDVGRQYEMSYISPKILVEEERRHCAIVVLIVCFIWICAILQGCQYTGWHNGLWWGESAIIYRYQFLLILRIHTENR